MEKMQPRDYLTFAELTAHWQMTENDLRFAIICGALKPCIRLNGPQSSREWDSDHDGPFTTPTYDVNHEAIELQAEGWYFLQDPRQTEPFGCSFYWASEDRNPSKEYNHSSKWYSLAGGTTLDVIIQKGVFLNVEITNYEADNPSLKAAVDTPSVDKPLGNRERETLLKLVIGMAIKGYNYKSEALKSDTPKEIADDLASLEIKMDTDTVRKYLKEAANTVLPAKPRQS